MVCEGQGQLHCLLHGHHPAHDRSGQRQIPGQPGHAHWQHRAGIDGRQPVARPEQRPGGLRYGRAAQRLSSLSAGEQPGYSKEVRSRLERQALRQGRTDHPRCSRGTVGRQGQGGLCRRGESHGERPGRAPRGKGPAGSGAAGGPGHLPHADGRTGACGAARHLLCRKGRHLQQHRTARPAGTQSD